MSKPNANALCLLLWIACCCAVSTADAQKVRTMPVWRYDTKVTTRNTIFTLWDTGRDEVSQLLRSVDGGANFERLQHPLIRDAEQVMVVDTVVYLAMRDGSMHRSMDLGMTWHKMPIPPGAEGLERDLKFYAQHGGGLFAMHGDRSLWMYFADTRVWSDRIYVPYSVKQTFRNGYDILFALHSRMIHVLDPYNQTADTITLPDFLGRVYSVDLINGHIIAKAYPDGIYEYVDDEMQLLARYSLGSEDQPKVLHVTDSYAFTQDGWLRRGSPEELHTYSEAMGLAWPFVAEGVEVGGEWLYLHDRFSVYRINMLAPDRMEHVWSDRAGLDRFKLHAGSNVILARNGNLVSTNFPTGIGAVASVSTDDGLSFHPRYADTCAYEPEELALLPNGDIWIVAPYGCNFLSTDHGESWKLQEQIAIEGVPEELTMYRDGSWWMITSGPKHYRSTGFRDPITPMPGLKNFPATGSPWGHAFYYRSYDNKIMVTADEGVTWDTVWHDISKKRGEWNAGFEPFSETEMAIILNKERQWAADTSEVYLYDINTKEVRLWATYRLPLVHMGRRPNGRLVAVMDDFSFIEYDVNDRPLPAVHDTLEPRRGKLTNYGFTLELTNDVAVFMTGSGQTMVRLDGSAVTTDLAEPTDWVRSSASVRLHPNPATDVVTIASSVPVDHYVVTDVMGRLVSTIPADAHSWSTSEEPSGVYYLSAVDRTGRTISTSTLLLR